MRWIPVAAAAIAAGLVLLAILPRHTPTVETSEQTDFVEIPYLAPPDPHENTTVVRIQIRVATLIAVGYQGDGGSGCDRAGRCAGRRGWARSCGAGAGGRRFKRNGRLIYETNVHVTCGGANGLRRDDGANAAAGADFAAGSAAALPTSASVGCREEGRGSGLRPFRQANSESRSRLRSRRTPRNPTWMAPM